MNIKRLIRETNRLDKQLEATKANIMENMKQIQAYFDENKIKEMEVYSDVSDKSKGFPMLRAIKVERLNITYSVDKLKETLDKEKFNEAIIRDYYVSDIDKLKDMFKEAGLSPKEFRECVKYVETPNKAAIQQMYDMGEITVKDIKKCATYTLSKYIQIKEKKGDKD
jgi:hypothetical protein